MPPMMAGVPPNELLPAFAFNVDNVELSHPQNS
jgi:hypothetical protein